MHGKIGMGTALEMGALLLGAAWLEQGCTPTDNYHICDLSYVRKEIIIVDDQGNPVDSAAITVMRTADGKILQVPKNEDALPYPQKGVAVIFDDAMSRDIPAGKQGMQIKVTASKDGKSGDGLYVIAMSESECYFQVKSGSDTLTIR